MMSISIFNPEIICKQRSQNLVPFLSTGKTHDPTCCHIVFYSTILFYFSIYPQRGPTDATDQSKLCYRIGRDDVRAHSNMRPPFSEVKTSPGNRYLYGVPLGSKVCIFSGTKINFSATKNNFSGTKNNFSPTTE